MFDLMHPSRGGAAAGAERGGLADRVAVAVCDLWLGSNGYAGMKALRRLGWVVHTAPEWESVPVHWRSLPMRALGRLVRPLAVREFNARLVSLALSTRASMVVVFKGSFVTAQALDALRADGIKSYCFYPDNSFQAHGPYIPSALPKYDWVFTAKSFGIRDLKDQLGVTRCSLLLHGFDPDLHHPVSLTDAERARYGCDASFIGTWSPKKQRLLEELIRRVPGVRLRVWGAQWDRVGSSSPLRAALEGRPAEGQEYVRAIAGSKVNIAILSERRTGSSNDDQITSRTFHIPASGGLMLHERTPEVVAILREDQEIACFDGAEELAAKVKQLLAHRDLAERVRASGHAAVVSAHAWDDRMRVIVDKHMQLCSA